MHACKRVANLDKTVFQEYLKAKGMLFGHRPGLRALIDRFSLANNRSAEHESVL
jgi:hypothetical protein